MSGVTDAGAVTMRRYLAPFGVGVISEMRSMSACAALTWAASQGRTRSGLIPGGLGAVAITSTAILAEMAGKSTFTPNHHIPPSFAFRLAIGSIGSLDRPKSPYAPAYPKWHKEVSDRAIREAWTDRQIL